MTEDPARTKDRTLTAMVAQIRDEDAPVIPLLLRAGRADRLEKPGEMLPLLLTGPLQIGRAGPDNHGAGTLPLDDALVSGRHAHLAAGAADPTLTDLDSKNGTFVNGDRISRPHPLTDGDCIFIGHQAFVYRRVSALMLRALDDERANPLGPVATQSPALALLLSRLRRLAATPTEILLGGETGVGKEIYARAIHNNSGRTGRFVSVNCAALPRDLIESELYGYRAGAHSTAHSAKRGLVEEAEGGTLFLDEIGELPLDAQSKLLRFVQDRELLPLGETRSRKIDVRILAATNRIVQDGPDIPPALRSDLLARLGSAPLILPPLRQRPEDLGSLITYLGRDGIPFRFDVPAFRSLFLHPWPLNVRELEKLLTSARALAAPTSAITLNDLPNVFSRARKVPPPLATGRKAPEAGPSAQELQTLLSQHQGNVAEVARTLGRQRAAVWRWMKKFGLSPKD